MPQYVPIVGDIPTRPPRRDVLDVLAQNAGTVQWEWVQAEGSGFVLPIKPFNRLLHTLRTFKEPDNIVVVKLLHLNGRDENTLRRAWNDLLLAPRTIESANDLTAWLLSPDAEIVAKRPWLESPSGVGLLAILSKLIKNKDWNKDVQGHQWTKEADLLGQSPVNRPDAQHVYACACAILERASTSLLLTKGAARPQRSGQ